MIITKLALNNNRMTWVFIALVISIGMMIYSNFPSREDPLIRINKAMIVAKFPGLAADKVEQLITIKIEEKLREITEIEFVNSTSKSGQAILTTTLFAGVKDYDKIWDKIRRKLNELKSVLPQGTIGPYINDDFGDVAIITAALTGPNWEMRELRQQARKIRDSLYTVDGVRRVSLYGVLKETAQLNTLHKLSESSSINLSQSVQSIQDQNRIVGAGTVQTPYRSINIGTSGKLSQLADLANVQMLASNGGILPLQDYFDITTNYYTPAAQLAYFNNQPAIVIAASMQKGRNILEIGPRIKAVLFDISAALPHGMELSLATFQPDVVDNAISNVKNSLYQTLIIVLVIVVLALGLSEGLIVGASVPLTILATLIVMHFLSIDLQFISLASLIIALGMLVDNAIVITESIHLKLAAGVARMQAALNSCKELALPLLTSTLTTVLAFAPILVANTTSGEFTRSLAQVVSISLLISWLLSLTVVPLLAVRFIKLKKHHKPFILIPVYKRLLHTILLRPRTAVALAVALFSCSLVIKSFVPTEMFSVSARSEVLVYIDLPAGFNLKQTQKATEKLTAWLDDKTQNPQVKYTAAYIGNGGPRFFLSIIPNDPAPNKAFIIVDAGNAEAAKSLLLPIRQFAAQQLSHANVRTELIARGTVPPGVVQLRFVGPDHGTLFSISQQAQRALSQIEGTIHVRNNWENKIKRFEVEINQAQARRLGVSYSAISQSLKATFTGSQVTEIRRGDTLIPVLVKSSINQNQGVNILDQVKVVSSLPHIGYVSLAQVASLKLASEFGSIVRRNMEKTVTVEGKHLVHKAPQLQALWDNRIQHITDNLPAGYRVELGGELEGFSKSAGTLFVTLPLFLGLILMILLGQFNSFKKMFIVTVTIPLAFSGGFIGLFVTGANFDFIAMLGFISLAGIIINNAIVLIDKIGEEQQVGLGNIQAITNACLNRLRPVIITTVTTIVALIPLMLMQESMFYAMASVITFGLGIGTVMTLGILPALYVWLIKDTSTINKELQ